jgi:hypothetical protein
MHPTIRKLKELETIMLLLLLLIAIIISHHNLPIKKLGLCIQNHFMDPGKKQEKME